VILLDTHIWIWWVHGDPRLTVGAQQAIRQHEDAVLGVSVISCWEVATLVERNRIALSVSLNEWIGRALQYPGVRLLDLTPRSQSSRHSCREIFTGIPRIASWSRPLACTTVPS
jgi:PIN domain nuclease of toxin-antitoxin system